MKRELVGTFRSEDRVFVNDDMTRVVIATIGDHEGKITTVKGEAAEGEFVRGLSYRFFGREITHYKYGLQFTFDSFVVETPATAEAQIVYLCQCDGIGRAIAKSIVDQYGDNAVEMLRTEPDSVASVTPRLTTAIATEAAAFLTHHVATERGKMDLLSLIHGRGFPKKLTTWALRDFGIRAAERIKRNPFLLLRYPGCGFITCDRMWLDLGHSPTRLKRQALCLWDAIGRNSDGSTWFAMQATLRRLHESIGGAGVQADKARQLCLRGRLLEERRKGGTTWIAEKSKADAEGIVAREVASMIESSENVCWPNVMDMDVSNHQSGEMLAPTQSRIGLLIGSPGTGKTYCVAEIVKSLLQRFHADEIAICAPTGKAAVRVGQAMLSAGIAHETRTIHSLLVVVSADGAWHFEHGFGRPLPHKFVIVDEASMLDTDLAASLLSACDRSTHVLFVGDVNQLAPVGHGAPLRDMIAAGVPTGELTEIRRNAGQIVRTCALIREKRQFASSQKLDLENGDNLYHVECGDHESQIAALESFLHRLQKSEHDPVWDIQIVVPINTKSPIGRKPLNARLQPLLNSRRPEGGNPFAIGDKIINLKNSMFSQPGRPEKAYVANGEQAEVVEVFPNRTIARLPLIGDGDERLVVIPRGTQRDKESDRDDENGDEQADTGCSWDLAYAISVHKSQGSEWPIVFVLADEHSSASRVQSRNWLYTAISRAKLFCITLGRMSVIESMLSRDGINRKTLLSERINEERERLRGGMDEFVEPIVFDGILEGVL